MSASSRRSKFAVRNPAESHVSLSDVKQSYTCDQGHNMPTVFCQATRRVIKRVWSRATESGPSPKARTTDLSTRISGANVIYTPDLATTQGYVLAYDRHKASEAKTAPACSSATLCHTRVASWNHVRVPRKADAVEARMRLSVYRRLHQRPHLIHLPTQHTPCQDLHY